MMPSLFVVVPTLAGLFAVLLGFGIGPASLLMARCSLPKPLWLPVALLVTMTVAYAVLWGYVVHPMLGRSLSLVCWVASVLLFVWLITAAPAARATRTALADAKAWLPVVLMLTLALAYLSVLLARDVPVNDRFTWPLPSDNHIPRLVAERFELPPDQRPSGFLLGDWLTSDRPPLQAALLLALAPFDAEAISGAHQVVGTVAQMGWLGALMALMSLIGCSRRQMMFVLLAAACSGFFLLNSLYVWPKLLAAWLFLVALALLYWPGRQTPRLAPVKWILVGLALGLSLLAHGGAVFSLLALPVLVFLLGIRRRERAWPALAVAGSTMALLLAPWIYFQQVVDPPGNRIPKMHLAGVVEIDDRSLFQAVRDEYRALSAADVVSARAQNLSAQVAGTHAPPSSTADALRIQQFFHHVPALDILTLGVITLLLGRPWPRHHSQDVSWEQTRVLVIYALVTVAVWALLMFVPGSTVIHQGSYVATSLLFMGGAIGLAGWPRALGTVALAVHATIFAWLWLATRHVTAPPAAWRPAYVLLFAVLAVLFVVLMRYLPEERRLSLSQGDGE